jgi:hypothetical protein
MPIRRYLKDDSAFEPEAIVAMSEALELVCSKLQIDGRSSDREIIARRIIDLARTGVHDANALADRVIAESKTLRRL